MKLLKSNLIAIMVCIGSVVQSYAYSIYGTVIDRSDNSSLPGATVTVMRDTVTVLMQATADEKGRFFFRNIEPRNLIVQVSYIGYTPSGTIVSGNGEDIDMSVIALDPASTELSEVTVYGSGIIEKPDRYLILPSAEELGRSSETMNLLSQLSIKMPGLRVNQLLQSATIDGRRPVYQINGKEESLTKVLALNHNNILRIEYRNNPDIRYADKGAAGIINFVMKPKQEGGSVLADVNASPMTGFINSRISGTYYHKKSEWSLTYANSWRDYDKQYISNRSEYIGRDEAITRDAKALPSAMSYFDNEISLGYTYMHDINTMFSASVGVSLADSENCRKNEVTEITGDRIDKYSRVNDNDSRSTSPSAELYFRKSYKNQSVEVNVNGTTSTGDYNRGMVYDFVDGERYSQVNRTHNSSWSGSGEVLYTRQYKNLTVRYGANYSHNHVKNEYVENDEDNSITSLDRDNLYLYGDIAGKWKRLGYSVGIGGKYFKSKDEYRGNDDFKMKSTVTMNYRLSNEWSLNYVFIYDPSVASLSSLSEEVQTIDDISLQMGNVDVRPSVWHRNRLFVRYNGKKFTATAWGSFSRTNDPIVSVWRYVSDSSSPYCNMFLRRTENGRYDNRVNLQLNLGWQNILNHFSLYGIIGWDDYRFVGNGYDERRDRMYANVSANAYWGNWTIFADFDIAPQYNMSGNTLSESPRFNSVGVQYKWDKWFFKCYVANPFTKRGFKTESLTVSDVHPELSDNYIKDNANMVVLGVTYRTNFGKSFKKSSKSLKSGAIDTGVNVNY
ncbi:MAG: TonB-dependent receptor [Muribaculaceae bacterium]|nr:TonB-dependent receptor [Muribaculaceae bacterium]